jgi:hypothetical protein
MERTLILKLRSDRYFRNIVFNVMERACRKAVFDWMPDLSLFEAAMAGQSLFPEILSAAN